MIVEESNVNTSGSAGPIQRTDGVAIVARGPRLSAKATRERTFAARQTSQARRDRQELNSSSGKGARLGLRIAIRIVTKISSVFETLRRTKTSISRTY
jgi:hypothetical protein